MNQLNVIFFKKKVRDSTNQVLPYIPLLKQGNQTNEHLKKMLIGLINRQVQKKKKMKRKARI